MRISPKLVVDNADEALDFYSEVFGGKVERCFTHRGKVVFAALSIGTTELQVKDPDGHDQPAQGAIVDVVCVNPDSVMAKALEYGATQVFPVADQPYGARQGRFRDPFGHQWLVGTEIRMSDDDIQAALDAME